MTTIRHHPSGRAHAAMLRVTFVVLATLGSGCLVDQTVCYERDFVTARGSRPPLGRSSFHEVTFGLARAAMGREPRIHPGAARRTQDLLSRADPRVRALLARKEDGGPVRPGRMDFSGGGGPGRAVRLRPAGRTCCGRAGLRVPGRRQVARLLLPDSALVRPDARRRGRKEARAPAAVI